MMLERWTFNLVLVYVSVIYWIYLAMSFDLLTIWYLIMTFYIIYVVCDYIQTAFVIFYSDKKWEDVKLALGCPLMPIYYAYQKLVTMWAITEELFTRRSFRDNFVPERVRKVTWHW